MKDSEITPEVPVGVERKVVRTRCRCTDHDCYCKDFEHGWNAALDAVKKASTEVPFAPGDALVKGLRKMVAQEQTEWVDANIVRLLLDRHDETANLMPDKKDER